MLCMALWKEFHLLQSSNDLSKHLIKLILYENDVKLLKVLSRVICHMFEVRDLIMDTWNEYIKKSSGMVDLIFYCNFNVRMPLI